MNLHKLIFDKLKFHCDFTNGGLRWKGNVPPQEIIALVESLPVDGELKDIDLSILSGIDAEALSSLQEMKMTSANEERAKAYARVGLTAQSFINAYFSKDRGELDRLETLWQQVENEIAGTPPVAKTVK